MIKNSLEMIDAADVGIGANVLEGVGDQPPKLDLSTLPAVVVSGTTLVDFSTAQSPMVRASVSLAMLYASRVATVAMSKLVDSDEDDWLARYNQALAEVGFAVSGSTVVHSSFKKSNVAVHKAIIPFLTLAFGGGAAGALIIQALKSLQEMDAESPSPWVTLFDKQTRRFNLREMHFAAVSANEVETTIANAVARLNVDTGSTQILFFKLSKSNANFDSTTTRMTANNGLLAVNEPKLQAKLIKFIDDSIAGADVG